MITRLLLAFPRTCSTQQKNYGSKPTKHVKRKKPNLYRSNVKKERENGAVGKRDRNRH